MIFKLSYHTASCKVRVNNLEATTFTDILVACLANHDWFLSNNNGRFFNAIYHTRQLRTDFLLRPLSKFDWFWRNEQEITLNVTDFGVLRIQNLPD